MPDTQDKKIEDQDQKSENVGGANQDEIAKLRNERDEYLNGWKRAKADLINYQKDETKRFQDVVKYGNENVVRELISVLDSFAALERSARSEPRSKDFERELGGVLLIKNQLEEVLRKQGLEKIKISPGNALDPNFHESLGEMESEYPSGTIAAEVESGYMLNGKVVRPARVKLAK